MMVRRTLPYVVAVSMLVLAFRAGAVSDKPPPALPTPSQVQAIINTPCPDSLERLLPGRYYFCTATRNFFKGKDAATVERLKDAAHWASKPAQYLLGLMYYNGEHVPMDRPLGIAWLAIAAERHDPQYEGVFISAFGQASRDERARANAYWQELRKEYADAVAGRLARRRYLHETRDIRFAAAFGGSVFLDGITPPNYSADGEQRGSPGWVVGKMLKEQSDDYFRGMDGSVTVGEVQSVPLGDVVGPASH